MDFSHYNNQVILLTILYYIEMWKKSAAFYLINQWLQRLSLHIQGLFTMLTHLKIIRERVNTVLSKSLNTSLDIAIFEINKSFSLEAG